MLEVRDLTYRPVLSGLSFRLSAGGILGLQGPSGCGKTTLGKLLAGHLRPDSGDILLDGQPVPEHGPCPIQLLFQHPETAVDPRWRIGEILREGWSPDAVTLARFGIQPAWLERYPHEVSGGELQRIAIVRALIPGLRLLICDELTASHDAITQVQIWRALQDHARQTGIALLVISHDTPLLTALAAPILRPWENIKS